MMVFVPRVCADAVPWTLVTYMFLHGGLTHLLFNMLGLFFFGGRVEARLGERRFITLYSDEWHRRRAGVAGVHAAGRRDRRLGRRVRRDAGVRDGSGRARRSTSGA
jgi:hypothetical protein